MTDISAPSLPVAAAVGIDRIVFWRRILAFVFDVFLLGLIGQTIGLFASPWLAELGPWGRLAGGAAGLCYFGIGNSWRSRGQTLGKKLLGIEVRRLDGGYLSVPAAMARALVLMLPITVNGLSVRSQSPVFQVLTFLIVFGLGGGILYFFFFNGSTRRSLHDLVTRSVVLRAVNASEPVAVAIAVPRVHFIIFGALLIVAALSSIALWRSVKDTFDLQALLAAQQKIAAATGTTNVALMQQQTMLGRRRDRWVTASAMTYGRAADPEQLANRIAEIVLRDVPAASTSSRVVVTITHGYDILFAKSWSSQAWSHTPAEWRQKLKITR